MMETMIPPQVEMRLRTKKEAKEPNKKREKKKRGKKREKAQIKK